MIRVLSIMKLVLMAGLFMLWGGVVGVRAAETLSATVTSTKGGVWISTAAGADWRVAEKGMKCGPAAQIKTGAGASAELLFKDGAALRIEKNTLMTIEKAQSRETVREYLFKLVGGRILSALSKPSKFKKYNFSVKTPICTAAIRGTEFVMEHSSETTHLAVFRGAVEAQSQEDGEKVVKVKKGKQTEVTRGESLTKPHPLSDEMESYRDNIAQLFHDRIESLRANMQAVKDMNEKYMKSRQLIYENKMEERQKSYQEIMEEFRKQHNVR